MFKDDIDNRFTYHPPTKDQIIRYSALREQARIFAKMIVAATPLCSEQILAINALDDCVARANSAIARHEDSQAPADPAAKEVSKLAEEYRRATYRNAFQMPVLPEVQDPEIHIDVKKMLAETKLNIRLAKLAADLLRNTPDNELPLEHLQLKQQLPPAGQPKSIQGKIFVPREEQPTPEWVKQLLEDAPPADVNTAWQEAVTAGLPEQRAQVPLPVFPNFEFEHPMLRSPEDLPGVAPVESYNPETVEKD